MGTIHYSSEQKDEWCGFEHTNDAVQREMKPWIKMRGIAIQQGAGKGSRPSQVLALADEVAIWEACTS